jgi:hypothetical protein
MFPSGATMSKTRRQLRRIGERPPTKGEGMPKYLALIYSEEPTAEPTPEQTAQVMEAYGEFTSKLGASGAMLGGEALHPTNTATTIHVEGGKGGEVVTTDGPFAETKEALGGFYLLDCADLDEALGWAAQIPGAWYGHVEVRPIVDISQG